MTTDLSHYLVMLASSKIKFELTVSQTDPCWTIVIVETMDDRVGYIGFCSQHAFDRTGKLVAVGGAE